MTTATAAKNHAEAIEAARYYGELLSMNLESVTNWQTGKFKADPATAARETERALERLADSAEMAAKANEKLAQTEKALEVEKAREQARRNRLRERQARAYFGHVVESYSTGTTHFLNSWNETFCGTIVEGFEPQGDRYRATCQRCCKAGDAAKRDGFASKVGSPASRM